MSIQYIRFPQISTEQRNQLFLPHANKAGSFLLDSGNSSHPSGRYDIMAVEPLQLIRCESNNSKPLDILQKHHHEVATSDIPDELHYLPFIGGLLFAFSYDLGRCFEKIEEKAEDDLNLANLYAGLFGCILIIDRYQHSSFLICSNEQSLVQYEEMASAINHIFQQQKIDIPQQFELLSNWSSNFTKQEYTLAFNQIQSYIQAGDCYQVNLAQRFKAKCRGSSWEAFCQLSEANRAPFSAYINTDEASILSLSPERFIKLENNKVETRPIKGTRPRGASRGQDQLLIQELLESTKDQAENLMIVDLMRNDLGKICKPGTIEVTELFGLESFDSVHHLVSTIIGQLDENENAFTLLANCFPGGSITGAPKIQAMNIIDELEPHRRSFYCGSVGYIDIRGNMDCSISIRTLVRKDNQLYCWAGGGLVSESDLDQEYQETYDKVSCILPILQNNATKQEKLVMS